MATDRIVDSLPKGFKLSFEHGQDAFGQMDANGDGVLSREVGVSSCRVLVEMVRSSMP